VLYAHNNNNIIDHKCTLTNDCWEKVDSNATTLVQYLPLRSPLLDERGKIRGEGDVVPFNGGRGNI